MHKSLPHPREAGFTLIELLVALAVLALAAGMLVGGLGGAWAMMAQGAGASGDDSVSSAQRILRARIERLSPILRTDSSDPIVDARGGPGLFSFAAPPLDRLSPDALQRFRVGLSPAGELTLYTASGLDDRIDLRDPALVGWQPTRLLSGVSEVEMSYYGPDRFSTAERWQARWDNRPQPPALVRIRLRFAAGDRRVWPDLIVRPRATVNAACLIDPATGRCAA